MTRRILLFIALVGVAVSQCYADGPFSRLFGSRRYSNSIQAAPPSRLAVRLSPEQMTKLYGPSILVRDVAKTEEAKPKQKSRFVTQP